MKTIFSKLFKTPSADELKAQELTEAERDLLKYEAIVEYAVAMRDMLRVRVERLKQK